MSSNSQEGSPGRNGDSRVREEQIAAFRRRLRGNGQNSKLMEELDRSLKEWRNEFEERKRLREEQARGEANRAPNNPQRTLVTLVRQIPYWFRPAVGGERPSPNQTNDEHEEGGSDDRKAEDGFKAGFLYFKKDGSSDSWEGYTHLMDGSSAYPNEKLTMRETLEGRDNNPLREAFDGDDLRYFHFPGNNMSWIEEAMKILYGGRAERLLAREFWRGQMYGAGERSVSDNEAQAPDRRAPAPATDPAPATIPSPTTDLAPTTPAGPIHARHMRPRFSIIPRDPIENSGKDVAIFLPYLHWETSSRRARMVEIVNEVTRSEKKKKRNDMSDVVNKVAGAEDQDQKKGSCLGEYLMAAAKVAEKMDYEDDEKLLRGFINKKAPLHVRRTLDQYYFPTLEDTSARDKDQVVFRNTGKLSKRVVMVDQLWLWIINDNTIITSFPRRWGRNKPDSSGIHKSLRDRLKNQKISSIYHLALIIIDQCSRVFFDRTKPLDQRPEVMDLFSSAIGNVIQNTSTAYERFWDNLKMESRKTVSVFGNTFNHRRLDINPEGIVLKEAQDIAEELRIMGRIFSDQWKVTKEFKRYLMYPEGERKEQPKEFVGLEKLLLRLLAQPSLEQGRRPSDSASPTTGQDPTRSTAPVGMRRAAHEAGELLEAIESRREEIQDLEESAIRACQQIEGLLTLKQQQTSIVEAKAALRRADESVKQGRTIMAFTLVTIFFLPLGFVATFFGMNNRDINDAKWMSLDEQIRYMFVATIAAVIVSVSVAFSAWPRAICQLVIRVPLKWLGVHTGLQDAWKKSSIHHENINRHTSKALRDLEQQKKKEKKEKKSGEDGNVETGHSAGSGSGTDLSREGEARAGDDALLTRGSYRISLLCGRRTTQRGLATEV